MWVIVRASEDARGYNELITAWSTILESAHRAGESGTQMNLVE